MIYYGAFMCVFHKKIHKTLLKIGLEKVRDIKYNIDKNKVVYSPYRRRADGASARQIA